MIETRGLAHIRYGLCAVFVLLCMLVGAGAMAQTGAEASREAASLEAQVQRIAYTLRCLVCQNQSIAESNAPLALDLREQVREQLQQGRTETEIADYMVERYGDFVLYRPPLKGATLLLWIGPFLLLLAGASWLIVLLRRRARQDRSVLTPAQRQQAQALLDDTPERS
ncbi:MAG: cytochrome c-type biogenesis protein [Corticimicrobacter sp.]|uniref:cytochrome c-type biogenesis protein n=1 Tax=Corticimicrobacter sp. TaxID=2678536 RepID=UPI0032DA6910